jgi:MHS family proline/betaine transporter-like MFS transporter
VPDSVDHATRADERRSEIISAFGAVAEWYDFSLYIYLAPVYGRVFFGDGDAASQLTATFGVFAIAFLARPIGAVVFGSYGDRKGRKQSLSLSALIMAVALLVNGLLPSEATAGFVAVALLMAVRLAMGFAVGGEYSGILVFLVETATARNRGLVVSWAPTVAGLGSLLAVGVSAAVTAALDESALDAWGWRIPVLVGAALALSVYFLRRRLTETASFEQLQAEHTVSASPTREVARRARGPLLATFLICAVGSIAYYLNVTYVPTFLTGFTDTSAATALRWSTIGTAVMLVTTPAFGALSDRVGRRPFLLVSAAMLAVATPLLFVVVEDATAVTAVAAVSGLAVVAGAWVAVSSVVIPEQFPAHVRFSGIAIGYNVAVAIFGGLTPFGATLLIDGTGRPLAPALIMSAAALLIVVPVLRLRETAGRPLPQ